VLIPWPVTAGLGDWRVLDGALQVLLGLARLDPLLAKSADQRLILLLGRRVWRGLHYRADFLFAFGFGPRLFGFSADCRFPPHDLFVRNGENLANRASNRAAASGSARIPQLVAPRQ